MSFLLDTCVISELVKREPARQVVEWIDGVADERLYLSVITVGEIKRGIEKLPGSERKQRLEDWLTEGLLARFRGRVLALDTPVLLTWGGMVARLEAKGRKMPAMDSLIAATCLTHELRLVTRNEKDFEGAGVVIVNPWK